MIRKRLSYANVMATLALFVALGGVGYAAVHLRRDSVGSRQIKENAVKASEQAPNSVDGSNVIDESLGGADIADGSIGSGDIADNAIGSAKIADGSIGGGDIGTGEVGAAQIGDGSVGRAELAPVDLRTPTFDDCAPSTPWQAVPNLPDYVAGAAEDPGVLQHAVQVLGPYDLERWIGKISPRPVMLINGRFDHAEVTHDALQRMLQSLAIDALLVTHGLAPSAEIEAAQLGGNSEAFREIGDEEHRVEQFYQTQLKRDRLVPSPQIDEAPAHFEVEVGVV